MKQKLNRTNFPASGNCIKSSSPGYNLMVVTDTFKQTRKMYQCLSDLSSHNTVHKYVTTETSASSSFSEEQFWQSWGAGKCFTFWSSLQLKKLSLIRITEIQIFQVAGYVKYVLSTQEISNCFTSYRTCLIPPSDDSVSKPWRGNSSFLLDVSQYLVLMNW